MERGHRGELPALATVLEEEDGRTCGELAQAMRESYAAASRMFAAMAAA
jgi:hypothetical protein